MTNRLQSLVTRGARAMAGLLLCVMSVGPLSACLIPQDDQVIGDLPPRKNSPPRIEQREPVGPETSYFTQMSCVTARQDFFVFVVDDDLQDIIYSLWFIDQGPSTIPFTPNATQPSASTSRKVLAPTAATFTNSLANLPVGKHLLTVYVADGLFNEVVNNEISVAARPVSTDAGVVMDRNYIDSFTWVLNVEKCP